jgi:hypothetical protein
MGLVISVVAGGSLWIILWSLGAKGLDAFLVMATVLLIGATLRIAYGYLFGRRHE